MKEYLMELLNGEILQKYITLVTAIVVFVLTSMFNHWRDRKLLIKSHDAELAIKYTVRNLFDPVHPEITSGKHSLLSTQEYRELLKDDRKKERARFILVENTAANRIFNTSITHIFKLNGKKTKRYYNQYFMDANETFYIFSHTIKMTGVSSHRLSIKYKTLAGTKYWVYSRSLSSGYKGLLIKSRIIFWFIPIVTEFNLVSSKTNTRRKILLSK